MTLQTPSCSFFFFFFFLLDDKILGVGPGVKWKGPCICFSLRAVEWKKQRCCRLADGSVSLADFLGALGQTLTRGLSLNRSMLVLALYATKLAGGVTGAACLCHLLCPLVFYR